MLKVKKKLRKKTFFLLIEILSEQKNIKTCSLFNKNANFKILALL
jgi:hypothetical protein